MSTTAVIAGNIIAAAGSLSLFISTALKGKKRIIGAQGAGSFFLLISDLLLGGYSGAVQDGVGLIRSAVILAEKNSRAINLLLVAAGVIPGIIFNNRGALGLLPVFANFEFACVTLYPKSGEAALKAAIAVSTSCWAAYCFAIQNYVSTAVNIVTAVSAVVFVIKELLKKRKGETENGKIEG